MSKHAPTKEPPRCLKALRFSAINCTLITFLKTDFPLLILSVKSQCLMVKSQFVLVKSPLWMVF